MPQLSASPLGRARGAQNIVFIASTKYLRNIFQAIGVLINMQVSFSKVYLFFER